MEKVDPKQVIEETRPLLSESSEDINYVTEILKEDPEIAGKDLNDCLEELKLRN